MADPIKGVTMAHQLTERHRFPGATLWVLAAATIVFAGGALLIIFWNPKVLQLALAAGLVAVATRGLFARVQATAHRKAEASSAVANTGMALAGLAVAPLIVFALLWMSLLLLLGAAWVLNALGLI